MSILRGKTFPLPKQVLIHRQFEENIKRDNIKDKLAILCEDTQLTFQQLNNEANKLSRCLLRKIRNDIKKSDSNQWTIGVQMEPSHRTVIALLAVLKVGGAYMPLDPGLPEERLRHILLDATPVCVITDAQSTPSAVENVCFLPFEQDLQAEIRNETNTENLPSSERGSQRLFAVLYTSGSTGTPKGICLPHWAVCNRLSWQWRQFPFQSGEVCCWKTSLSFVDSIAEIFAPLLQGIPLVVCTRSESTNVEKLVPVLDKYSVSRLTLVPSLLKMLLLFLEMRPNEGLSSKLKLWVCSGETLPKELLEKFFERFPLDHIICNFYGSTEVMGDVTFESFSSAVDVTMKITKQKVPIGKPIHNTTAYLIDEKFKVVPTGEMGEIVVSGLNLAAGTIRGCDNSFIEVVLEANKKETVYRTGDFGRIQHGVIYYEGRKDSQLKIRGHRVDLTEVEAAIKRIEGIISVAVLCHQPNTDNQTIIAFYVKQEDGPVESVLKCKLEKHLPNYMIPVLFEVKTIPLLPTSGKIDRQALISIFESSRGVSCWEDQLNVFSEKQRNRAAALLKTVSSVLGPLPNEVLRKSFFEIGGNSLNVLAVLHKLIKEGYTIEMACFMKCPTLLDVINGMKETMDTDIQIPHTTSNFKRTVSYVSTSRVDKYEASDLLAMSFATKGMLEKVIQREHGGFEVLRRDYRDTFLSVWEVCTSDYHSFAALDPEGKLQAVSLFITLQDALNTQPQNYGITMAILLQLCLDLLAKAKDRIPEGNILYSFGVGVNPELPSSESLEVITAVEEENVKVAREKGYTGIMSINVSPVTQQLTEFVLGYDVLVRVQVNQHVFQDGTKPYASCPDDNKATLALKIF